MKLSNPAHWRDGAGNVIACTEKIKVLNENLEELRQVAQDAFEDGVLMACCEQQLRDAFVEVIGKLTNPYSSIRHPC